MSIYISDETRPLELKWEQYKLLAAVLHERVKTKQAVILPHFMAAHSAVEALHAHVDQTMAAHTRGNKWPFLEAPEANDDKPLEPPGYGNPDNVNLDKEQEKHGGQEEDPDIEY